MWRLRGDKIIRLVMVVILTVSLLPLGGCGGIVNTKDKSIKISCENFTERESYILSLTGNQAVKYKFDNLPVDRDYELNVVYEVYENGEKIKEEIITGIRGGIPEDGEKPIKSGSIALNLQDDMIRMIWGSDSMTAYAKYEPEEDLSQYSRCFLQKDISIDLGEEVYAFYAISGENLSVRETMWNPTEIGLSISDKDIGFEENPRGKKIYIKLVLREI